MILIFDILKGVRWYPRRIFICIFLITKDVEHFLKCISPIRDSSVEKSLFGYAPRFITGLFGILISSFLSSLYILEISPLSDVGLVKIFSHYVGCCFVLLTLSFALRKLLSFRICIYYFSISVSVLLVL